MCVRARVSWVVGRRSSMARSVWGRCSCPRVFSTNMLACAFIVPHHPPCVGGMREMVWATRTRARVLHRELERKMGVLHQRVTVTHTQSARSAPGIANPFILAGCMRVLSGKVGWDCYSGISVRLQHALSLSTRRRQCRWSGVRLCDAGRRWVTTTGTHCSRVFAADSTHGGAHSEGTGHPHR